MSEYLLEVPVGKSIEDLASKMAMYHKSISPTPHIRGKFNGIILECKETKEEIIEDYLKQLDNK